MIISRSPFRVSFAGGGSDLKEYFANYGGSVLSSTINKYIYLSMHPYFNDNKILLKYSKNELVDNLNKIDHKIIKQVFTDYNIKGVDFNSSADIPAGTGLGSSSAFTCALIKLCSEFQGKNISKYKLAENACKVEIDKLKEPIGKQDQFASAYGGINFIKFNSDNSVAVEKIKLSDKKLRELNDSLMMFYVGGTRSASKILKNQKKNTLIDREKIENLHKMVRLSEDLKIELSNDSIENFGEILHQGWMYKRELAKQISNNKINNIYETAIKMGAKGGKLLGAGSTGFLLFFADKINHCKIRNSLSELSEMKFKFEFEGTKIIYKDNHL